MGARRAGHSAPRPDPSCTLHNMHATAGALKSALTPDTSILILILRCCCRRICRPVHTGCQPVCTARCRQHRPGEGSASLMQPLGQAPAASKDVHGRQSHAIIHALLLPPANNPSAVCEMHLNVAGRRMRYLRKRGCDKGPMAKLLLALYRKL